MCTMSTKMSSSINSINYLSDLKRSCLPSSHYCLLNSNNHGHHVACALIGMSHKLATYIIWVALNEA